MGFMNWHGTSVVKSGFWEENCSMGLGGKKPEAVVIAKGKMVGPERG